METYHETEETLYQDPHTTSVQTVCCVLQLQGVHQRSLIILTISAFTWKRPAMFALLLPPSLHVAQLPGGASKSMWS